MPGLEPPHDPGPWTVDTLTDESSYAAAIRRNWDGGRKTIAYVEGPGLNGPCLRRRASGLRNAAVIGAAPAMQAALLAARAALAAGRPTAALRAVEAGLRGEMPS